MAQTQARLQVLGGGFIGSKLDFFTITTTNFDISGVDAASNNRLNLIVQTIAAHGQPVIMDLISATSLRFAIEHTMAWGADGSALATALTAALAAAASDQDAGLATQFTADVGAGATFSVAKASGL